MTATLEQEAPAAVSADFTARKLRLIEYIIRIEEEADLLEFERIAFGFLEDDATFSEAELALLDERLDTSKNNPDEGISLENYLQKRQAA